MSELKHWIDYAVTKFYKGLKFFFFFLILVWFFEYLLMISDNLNIKILNAGAWARGSDRVAVSLPMELEDFIPEVEDFYRKKHSGRKLQWHHHMSNGTVSERFQISFSF